MAKKYFLILTLLACSFGFSQIQQDIVEVYPNPFKDKVTIRVNKSTEEIKVFDVLGKQIIATNDTERLRKLMLKLRSGIYLLRITDTKGNVETKKIVKQ